MTLMNRVSPSGLARHLLNLPPPAPKPVHKPPEPGIVIGLRPDDKPFRIPDSIRFGTHTVIAGSSGTGKSFLMRSMIIQELAAKRGCLVVDPHGSLAAGLLRHLVDIGFPAKDLVYIDPLSDHLVKMNPLQGWGGEYDGSDLTVDVLTRVAGERDVTKTPLFAWMATMGCMAMEEARMPLAALSRFYRPTAKGIMFRNQVLREVTNEDVTEEWENFEALSMREKRLELASPINRVSPYVSDPRVRRMVSHSSGNLDFREAMDEGKLVIANLGPRQGKILRPRSAQLLGSLLILGVRYAAFRRELGGRPFMVYCDEAARYINDDVADNLDELRKFGVHFTLAIHRLSQLKRVSDDLMEAVLNQCQCRLVFGGLGRKDAEVMCMEMFTGEIHGDEVKYETRAVSHRPILTWVDVVSLGQTQSETFGTGSGVMTGIGTSLGNSYTPIEGFIFADQIAPRDSKGESSSKAESSSEFHATSYGETRSVTRSPLHVYEEFLQEPNRTYKSLDEQREKRIGMLMTQKNREVSVKYPGQPVQLVTTLKVIEKNIPPPQVGALLEASRSSCECSTTPEDADAALLSRLSPVAGNPGSNGAPKRGRPRKVVDLPTLKLEPDTQAEETPPPAAGNGHAVDELGL